MQQNESKAAEEKAERFYSKAAVLLMQTAKATRTAKAAARVAADEIDLDADDLTDQEILQLAR